MIKRRKMQQEQEVAEMNEEAPRSSLLGYTPFIEFIFPLCLSGTTSVSV